MPFVLRADVCRNKMQKSQGCFTSALLSAALGDIPSVRNVLFCYIRAKNKTSAADIFHEVLIRDYDFDLEGKHLLAFESKCRYRLLNQVSAVQKRASLPLPVIQSIDGR